jgi:hypothetical protein
MFLGASRLTLAATVHFFSDTMGAAINQYAIGVSMNSIAVTELRVVASSQLTPPSAPSVEVNRERLSQVDEALSLTQNLRRVLEASAPSEDIVRVIYGALIRLERLCEEDGSAGTSVDLKVLAESAKAAKDSVHVWYLHTFGEPWEFVQQCKLTPHLYNFDAKREAPTKSGVASLEGTLAAIRQGVVNLARAAEKQ